MKKVVGTLTTIPPKYVNSDNLLNSLISLNNQTYKLDVIYLTLPYRCERLNMDYPKVSNEIKKLCTIVRYDDCGPITKLMGALLNENADNTIMISFDDDIKYHPRTVEMLVQKHQIYPNAAIGSSGMLLKNTFPNCAFHMNIKFFADNFINFKIPKNGREIDSLFGFSSILYVRGFFPKKKDLYEDFLKMALNNDNLKINDDIYISGILEKKNIKRIVFDDIPKVVVPFFNKNKSEISSDGTKFIKKLNSAIIDAKSFDLYTTTEQIYFTETITFKILSLLLIIIIIIILFYYYNNIYNIINSNYLNYKL